LDENERKMSMKVVISKPSKRLFSFQSSEEERDKNTGNIFSLFLPLQETVWVRIPKQQNIGI
jgi:hypothetical protein